VGLPRKRKKRKKVERRKSQNRYISPHGGAILPPICTKFGEFTDLTAVITPPSLVTKIAIGFSRPRGGIKQFPVRKTALACGKSCYKQILRKCKCDFFLFYFIGAHAMNRITELRVFHWSATTR